MGKTVAEDMPGKIDEAITYIPLPEADGTGEVKLGTWKAIYLGNSIVEKSEGDETVMKVVTDLAESKDVSPEACKISVSNRHVVSKGGETFKEKINAAFIRVITYISVIPSPDGDTKKKIFGYIMKNIALDSRQCFIFGCDSQVAMELSVSVARAFKIHKDLPNPFKAPSKQSMIKPPKSLAKAEIRRRYLTSTGVVGAGQFGEVHLAELDTSKTDAGPMASLSGPGGRASLTVAVKLLKLSAPQDSRDEFVRECEAMLELVHPNLCAIHGVSVRRRPWLCIIELMKYGDLQITMKQCKKKKFDPNIAEYLFIAEQTARGMSKIGDSGWVHMDLAARNVLVTTNLVCKVADFGLTRRVDRNGNFEQTARMKLPMKWMALESMDKRLFSEKSDVWSYGVTMWEMFTAGAVPYGGVKNNEIQAKLRAGTRLARPLNCPGDVWKILVSTWLSDPESRPRFIEIANHLEKLLAAAKATGLPVRDIGKELTTGINKRRQSTTEVSKRGSILQSQIIKEQSLLAVDAKVGDLSRAFVRSNTDTSGDTTPPHRTIDEGESTVDGSPTAIANETAIADLSALAPSVATIEKSGPIATSPRAIEATFRGKATEDIAVGGMICKSGNDVFVIGAGVSAGTLKVVHSSEASGAVGEVASSHIIAEPAEVAIRQTPPVSAGTTKSGFELLPMVNIDILFHDSRIMAEFSVGGDGAVTWTASATVDEQIPASRLLFSLQEPRIFIGDEPFSECDVDLLVDAGRGDLMDRLKGTMGLLDLGLSVDQVNVLNKARGRAALAMAKARKGKYFGGGTNPSDRSSVGKRCTVQGYPCRGTIKYFGVAEGRGSGQRVLVELDSPVGTCNGTVAGHTYGTCRLNRGVLVLPSNVQIVRSQLWDNSHGELLTGANGSEYEQPL
jgi:serine/threonine protein kinase